MNDLYRHAGGGGARMAVTEPKQTDYNSNKNDGEYWQDVHNELSPVRKHLIHTYLQIQDDEALPLLGEYFGVALSFMAMGALVRASNSSKKRRKSLSDEERLDLRACSRFQRMALESMLREAMERLRGLAQNAYQMEERIRDLVEAEMQKDKEKVVLLSRVAEAEKAVHELKALRKAEGKANERVMSIVAAKEQDWLKEKRNLQKEIERLKENLNTVCREVKFQSRRCRSPTCEHCKGIERVVRNVRGRVSLRELNSRETLAHASPRREVVKVEQPPEVEEVEEERVLVKALEQKKKRSERPGHLQVQDKVGKHEKPVSWTASRSSVNPSGGSAGGAGQYMNKELIAKQQQEMESELANILKRVGMLKQRSHSNGVTTTGQQNADLERKTVSTSLEPITSLESRTLSVEVETVNIFSDKAVSELTKVEAVEEEQASRSFVSGPELELADDLTTGLLTFEQEALLSVEEDPDLLELEKAFEFDAGLGIAETTNASGEGNQQDAKNIANVRRAETAEEVQIPCDEDTEIAEFESCLSREVDISEDVESEEAETLATSAPDSNFKEVLMDANADATEVLESDVELAFSSILETTTAEDTDQVWITTDCAAVSEFFKRTRTTDVGESDDQAVREAENPVVDVDGESLEQCEKQDTPSEVEGLERIDSLTDVVSVAESDVSGEQSGSNETTMETASKSDQSASADSGWAESFSEILSHDFVDGEGWAEPVFGQDDCCELLSEISVSPVDEDKSLPEDLKIVDAGDSTEAEQVLEVVEMESGAGLAERHDISPEDVESVESSASEADPTRLDEDAVTTVEKSELDVEIPVFERAGSRDLGKDLPEPDEKRVCDTTELEVDVAGDAGFSFESLYECSSERSEEGESEAVDDLVTSGVGEILVESESVADPLKLSSDSQGKINVAEDSASLHEQKQSANVAVEVGSDLGAE